MTAGGTSVPVLVYLLVGCNQVLGLREVQELDAQGRCASPPTVDLTSPYAMPLEAMFYSGAPAPTSRSQSLQLGMSTLVTVHDPTHNDQLWRFASYADSITWGYDTTVQCIDAGPNAQNDRSPVMMADGSLLFVSDRGDAPADPLGPLRVWRAAAIENIAPCVAPITRVVVAGQPAGSEVVAISNQPGTSRMLLTIRDAGQDDLWEYELDGSGGTLQQTRRLDELDSPCVDAEAYAPTPDVIAFSSTRLDAGGCGVESRLFWSWRTDPTCPYQAPIVVPVPAEWTDVHDPWLTPALTAIYAASQGPDGLRIQRATRQ